MFHQAQLNELAQARRLVILQSDIHRRLIQVECTAWREQLTRFQAAGKQVTASRPVWIAAAALAGVVAVRRWRGFAKVLPALFAGWRLWRSFARPGKP